MIDILVAVLIGVGVIGIVRAFSRRANLVDRSALQRLVRNRRYEYYRDATGRSPETERQWIDAETRISELEGMVQSQASEIRDLQDKVSFLTRLLDHPQN